MERDLVKLNTVHFYPLKKLVLNNDKCCFMALYTLFLLLLFSETTTHCFTTQAQLKGLLTDTIIIIVKVFSVLVSLQGIKCRGW